MICYQSPISRYQLEPRVITVRGDSGEAHNSRQQVQFNDRKDPSSRKRRALERGYVSSSVSRVDRRTCCMTLIQLPRLTSHTSREPPNIASRNNTVCTHLSDL